MDLGQFLCWHCLNQGQRFCALDDLGSRESARGSRRTAYRRAREAGRDLSN